MDDRKRNARLALPDDGKKLRAVIDSDAFNEVDDLFAISWALLSKERFQIEAIYAEPFLNFRCTGIKDAMEKSYKEVQELLKRFNVEDCCDVLHGADDTITATGGAIDSEACRDLIKKALFSTEEPLYVVCLGPLTTVASAIMVQPEIMEHIVVVWMGYGVTEERFRVPMCPNTMVDIDAARYVLDSGVPFIQVPGAPVTSGLITTIHDLRHYLQDQNALSNFLLDRFELWQKSWASDEYAWSKSLWDCGAIAVLLHPEWRRTYMMPKPEIPKGFGMSSKSELEYYRKDERYPKESDHLQTDQRMHAIRVVYEINRNKVYNDLYKKIAGYVDRSFKGGEVKEEMFK